MLKIEFLVTYFITLAIASSAVAFSWKVIGGDENWIGFMVGLILIGVLVVGWISLLVIRIKIKWKKPEVD